MRIKQKRRTRILKDKTASGEKHGGERISEIMEALKASIKEAHIAEPMARASGWVKWKLYPGCSKLQ
jgi:hypothetical protein